MNAGRPRQYAEAFGVTDWAVDNLDEIAPVPRKALDVLGAKMVGVNGDYKDK